MSPAKPSAAPPVVLTAAEASHARFCFMGEFGYELVSWIPYLLFLKEKLGVRIRTVGRVGSSVFYYFSDEHVELTDVLPDACWGKLEMYRALEARFNDAPLVYPGPEAINRRRITVDGYDWRNLNIHTLLDATHCATPDYSFVPPYAPVGRPFAVINNKYYLQWPTDFPAPVNYFDRESLVLLRDFLHGRGYGVVYNHYVEKTADDVNLKLDDENLFDSPIDFDMRRTYTTCATAGERNRLQLGLYNAASLVVGPQGGNLYLPMLCKKPTYILMRHGIFLDYLELGRLYHAPVEMFYEPKHMLCWLEKHLAPAGR